MRSLTILLPHDFIEEVDKARGQMTGVRSRSAALHLLAELGLRLVKAEASDGGRFAIRRADEAAAPPNA